MYLQNVHKLVREAVYPYIFTVVFTVRRCIAWPRPRSAHSLVHVHRYDHLLFSGIAWSQLCSMVTSIACPLPICFTSGTKCQCRRPCSPSSRIFSSRFVVWFEIFFGHCRISPMWCSCFSSLSWCSLCWALEFWRTSKGHRTEGLRVSFLCLLGNCSIRIKRNTSGIISTLPGICMSWPPQRTIRMWCKERSMSFNGNTFCSGCPHSMRAFSTWSSSLLICWSICISSWTYSWPLFSPITNSIYRSVDVRQSFPHPFQRRMNNSSLANVN